ncbi:methyltransferase [Pseudofrankia inefficax]|uniref:O-methyltransferase family 2 n=1 Tax=Pseudofrankia inefficax (strain DSM 45817 / CECT 9037 / DDB 130130 / EuI1c) TaxID=298654 RepID=E3J3Q2_PSEI1|nr:methyltransferase [Pseudofrankia inefficax]ADP79389.1 O-methyltransferase family 2 [Pseudofrankia inefficax]
MATVETTDEASVGGDSWPGGGGRDAGSPPGVAAPTVRMIEFQDGLRLAHLLCAIAEIGVADAVPPDGAIGVAELAERTGTNPGTLYRALRAVASRGVFTEVAPATFALTPLAATLRSDAAGSLRDTFRLQGQPFIREAYAAIGHSLRTGEPSFEHVHGTSLFSYLRTRPEASQLFSDAMGNAARQVQRAALEAYDLSGARRLVDVGGAHGQLVAAVLARYPTLTGVVFDRPEVVPGAADVLRAAGVADRAELVGGDYLRSVPGGGDVYVISHVTHQLSDEDAVTVLTNIRAVMAPNARIVIIDPVIPDGDVAHPGKFMDITMMALTWGRDRTEAEFSDLFARSGLRHARTVALSAPSSVVVATAA